MINTDSMDESYLFQLEMLKDQISVINYIEKVVAYEKSIDCHIDNQAFHNNIILAEDIIVMEK